MDRPRGRGLGVRVEQLGEPERGGRGASPGPEVNSERLENGPYVCLEPAMLWPRTARFEVLSQ